MSIKMVEDGVMLRYGFLQGDNSPCPQAKLRIYNPSNNAMSCEVDAIVDSGALMSCVPESSINQLGALEYKLIGTRSFDKKINTLKKSCISIQILDTDGSIYRDCGEIEVIAVPNREYAIIGRNILNKFRILLDAPNGTWKILTDKEYECIVNL